VFIECLFEMCMTQVALFDIYVDVAFAVLASYQGLTGLCALSTVSLCLLAVPKLYGLGLSLYLMFSCGKAREEDERRKLAHRLLVLSEFRMQALNVEYTRVQREKVDILMSSLKFTLEDAPQFILQLYYLTQTDCGLKNPNTLFYIGFILKALNTYFGLFYRVLMTCYVQRRLGAFSRRVEVSISNLQLACFGYRNIRNKIDVNGHVESLVFAGETYEYLVVNEKSVGKLTKCLAAFPVRDKIEFLDLCRVRIESVRQVKALFVAVQASLPQLRYLTVQQSALPASYLSQFKGYLDGNDSLVRLSLVMNQVAEDDCLEIMESVLDHPNLEVFQLADKLKNAVDLAEEPAQGKKKKKGAAPKNEGAEKLSICKSI
jgi:hypothetical protein